MRKTIAAIGNTLYRTPWWAIALLGLFVMLMLALFTIPHNVIRFSDAGKSTAENRAIQREVDRSFGNSALNIAERVVEAVSERTTDPGRRAELEQALRDIERARHELLNKEHEAKLASEHTQLLEKEAEQSAKENARAAREAMRIAKESMREDAQQQREQAKQKVEELVEARKEAKSAQTRVGINDEAALTSFDNALKQARNEYNEAAQRIRDIKSGKIKPVLADEGNVKIDSKIGDTSIKGNISFGDPANPILVINGKDIPSLPADLRADIRNKVASDVRRLGIGSALIVTFIPLFIMLLIAKFYIGRSRRALEVASVKTREAESANVNRQIVEAKLMALQAQVEPHFLYNTLANVQALTEVDPPRANQMTGHLIQYLRAALPKMRESTSTVGQELELVRAYLNILKMRMDDRLQFDIHVADNLLALPFPPLMLPSLVENAIKHGLEPQREGGRIDVHVEKIGEGNAAIVRMIVRDTGRGLTDAPIQAGGGVGLNNIRERLLALFGDHAKLTLESNQPKGVTATIDVPAAGSNVLSQTPPLVTSATTVGHQSLMPASWKDTSKSWGAKTISVAARTHSVWFDLMVKVFIGIVAVLGVVFVVALIGIATDAIPLSIGNTKLRGVEGMGLGIVVLLLAFGLLSIVALILIAIIYGLGFMMVALAIGIPLLVLLSIFPALIPLFIVGFAVYWFWWRKRKKPTAP